MRRTDVVENTLLIAILNEEVHLLEDYALRLLKEHENKAVLDIISTQKEWSRKTFGEADERGGEACVHHLMKEAKELADDPSDIMEGVDIFILLMDWLWREGFTWKEFVKAVKTKQEINEKRVWGEPDENGIVEHIE